MQRNGTVEALATKIRALEWPSAQGKSRPYERWNEVFKYELSLIARTPFVKVDLYLYLSGVHRNINSDL